MQIKRKVKIVIDSILESYDYELIRKKQSNIPSSVPSFLSGYWQDCFNLKQHLQEFLKMDLETIEARFKTGKQDLTELGHHDFDWEKATEFYRDRVGEAYLFELGIWHLTDREQIGGALQLIANRAQGRVLDFGGGIGTHTLGAALCPQVQQVIYCDINPVSLDFVKYRVRQMGLEDKVVCCFGEPPEGNFDTILCFDVLEHLPDPSQQLLQFHKMLSHPGNIMLNWWFFKGFNQEWPFHLDDPQAIDKFFETLQENFIESFHPYSAKSRCYYKKSINE
jgi:2-polyprenyl-3-methyl-5-hydroxy-6-metoxy-1,4-benzoquinol methylase